MRQSITTRIFKGATFGHLKVIGDIERLQKDKYIKIVLCSCSCGIETKIRAHDLIQGKSIRCRFCPKPHPMKHGMTKTPTYRSWLSMRERCGNPKSKLWKWYGGRGIKICERWDGFELFYKDMGHRPKGHSLDRIDNNGNYEPSNCRWATQQQQLLNTSRNIYFKYKNQKLTLSQISKIVNIEYSLLYRSIFYRGNNLETAILKAENRIKKTKKN